MKRTIISLICVCMAGCLLPACTMTLTNDGEVGFEATQSFKFVHRTAKTSDESAVSNIAVPALMEWVAREPKPDDD